MGYYDEEQDKEPYVWTPEPLTPALVDIALETSDKRMIAEANSRRVRHWIAGERELSAEWASIVRCLMTPCPPDVDG